MPGRSRALSLFLSLWCHLPKTMPLTLSLRWCVGRCIFCAFALLHPFFLHSDLRSDTALYVTLF